MNELSNECVEIGWCKTGPAREEVKIRISEIREKVPKMKRQYSYKDVLKIVGKTRGSENQKLILVQTGTTQREYTFEDKKMSSKSTGSISTNILF